jgi:aryl-phospho-beta-D-glucosidase BglC (GH1 family)
MFTKSSKFLFYMVISMLLVTMIITNTISAISPSGRQIVASDFLRSEAGYLKNQNNQMVCLRGVNAGGWLIQESWMCPINGADRQWANLDTLNTLKNRGFTDAQIQTLFTTYQNNWFSITDLDNLQAMHVNCLRVPFWYRNFMLDEAGTWITGTDLNSNPGIQKLDWVINECGKRGIYVVLDCHGAPGGQNMDHSCGTLARNDLYDSPALRAVFDDMWTKIAQRYNGNPVVAAYDIMNEPQNNEGYSGPHAYPPGSTRALSRTYSVYDEVYKAIRAVDTGHVITMEAIWTGTCLPNPATYGWTNVLYSMHLYDTSTSMIDTRVNELINFQTQYGVAVYVGEFNCDPYEEYAMDKFNQAGISWTTWAYKGSKQSIGNNWFLYVKQLPYADSTVDDYNTIMSKWGTVINTSNFDTNINTVYKWITNNIDDPLPGEPTPTPGPTATPTPTPDGSSSVWYQNFESGTGFTAGTKATAASYADTANTGGSKCVKLTVNSSGDPGTSSRCVKVTPQNGSSIDASSKNYLLFFVKDTQGANTIRVTIIDTGNASWNGWTSAQSAPNQWTKISVALSSVSGINKAAIKEIRLGEWNAGTYYFDDICFAVNSSDGIPAF